MAVFKMEFKANGFAFKLFYRFFKIHLSFKAVTKHLITFISLKLVSVCITYGNRHPRRDRWNDLGGNTDRMCKH